MDIELLQPFIQTYSWGHTSWLQNLLGYHDSDGEQPWAELWLGTHPKGMAQVVCKDGKRYPLAEYLMQHAGGKPGIFQDSELPFLFKVLAVASPLSIQCHPTREQAEDGFSREESAGIPIDSPLRNYRDTNHKPEILCAVTPFTAMCGFRQVSEIINLFGRYLPDVYRLLFGTYFENEQVSEAQAYRHLLTSVLTISGSRRAACMQLIRNSLASLHEDSQEIELVKRFISLYPEDPSVLAPLYLQLINLEPGEALYQPAGELHAYVSGVGIELMANSDNVLRGGLTTKHVDADELLRIVRFHYSPKHKTHPFQEKPQQFVYHTPAQDFELYRMDAGRHVFDSRQSVELALQLTGESSFSYTDPESRTEKTFTLAKGCSCMIPVGIESLVVQTTGTVYAAGIPEGGEPR
ncbi:MAG: mannose-6-phosphate isomerase, class I [Spirochaetota bacterium]